MSRRIVVASLAVTLLAAAGWALAQPGPPARPSSSRPEGPPVVPVPGQPAQLPKAKGSLGGAATFAAGHFAVVPIGQSAVLLELRTGRTWVLTPGTDGDAAWLPVKRLDTDQEVRQWFQKERERAAERDTRQREMARRLEGLQREMSGKLESLQRELAGTGQKGGGPGGRPKGPGGAGGTGPGAGKGPRGLEPTAGKREHAGALERMRLLTPAQRRDRINQLPAEIRDRVRQLFRRAGLEVAD